MVIRVKPEVGQLIIINKSWFEDNAFFAQFMQNIKPGKVYEITRIEILEDEYPDEWGIAGIKCIETDESFDIKDHDELNDYWCVFDRDDAIRIVAM